MRERIVSALARGLLRTVLPAAAVIVALVGPPTAAAAQPPGAHPQAVTDQTGLDRLRTARTGDHAWLAGSA